MTIQITTRQLRLRSDALARLEQHLQDAFRFCDSNLSGIDVQLSASQGSHREFTCRVLLRLNRSGDVVINDRGERLSSVVKRATRRASAAVRKRCGRKRTLRRRGRRIGRPLSVA